MEEDDCLFCGIIKGEVPTTKVVETDTLLFVLVPKPMSEGHGIIFPKKHSTSLHETADVVVQDILLLLKQIAKAMGYESYTILQNSGGVHVHFHLIPRDENDEPMLDAPRFTPTQDELNSLAKMMQKKIFLK
jgi:diadenosine tetraphosphate (Ap4A) HIT family hydrolase